MFLTWSVGWAVFWLSFFITFLEARILVNSFSLNSKVTVFQILGPKRKTLSCSWKTDLRLALQNQIFAKQKTIF